MDDIDVTAQFANVETAKEIWLALFDGLKANLPLKTYICNWMVHSNCFNGNDAANVLYSFMRNASSIYRQGVTRQKIVKILEKFRQCGLIVPVDESPDVPFSDGDSLYRFDANSDNLDIEEIAATILPLYKPINGVVLTPGQIELVYKEFCLEFLKGELGSGDQIVNSLNIIENLIDGCTIIDNMLYIDNTSQQIGLITGVSDNISISNLLDLYYSALVKDVCNLSSDMIRTMFSFITSYYKMLVIGDIIPPPFGCLINACLAIKNVSALQIALVMLPTPSYRVLHRYFVVMSKLVRDNSILQCHVNTWISLISMEYKCAIEDIYFLSNSIWDTPHSIKSNICTIIDDIQNRKLIYFNI